MKALLIDKNASGIVNLQNIEYLQLKDIKDFKDIELQVHTLGKFIKDFKYHVFEDDDFVPLIFRVVDGFYNQMQEFSLERVTYKELPLAKTEKKAFIENVIKNKREAKKKELILGNLEALYYAQVDEAKQESVLEITAELDELNKEIIYTDYLDELV